MVTWPQQRYGVKLIPVDARATKLHSKKPDEKAVTDGNSLAACDNSHKTQ